jgi:hypothetical protein
MSRKGGLAFGRVAPLTGVVRIGSSVGVTDVIDTTTGAVEHAALSRGIAKPSLGTGGRSGDARIGRLVARLNAIARDAVITVIACVLTATAR